MKESEFIELLNLYLDHEISAADAARLEAEVQANPARRQIYRQYCRMQKACGMVAADFRTEPRLAAEITRKVVPFEAATAQPKRTGGLYYATGAIAAAACVALVFVNRERPTAPVAPARAVVAEAAPVSIQEAAAPASAPSSPRGLVSLAKGGPSLTTGATLGGTSFLLSSQPASGVTLTSGVSGDHQLAWINSVQLAPLPQRVPMEDLRFDARPSSLRSDGRPLGGIRPANDAEESIAWRFAK